MNKVFASAAAALAGVVKDDQTDCRRRLRPVRHSRGADRRAARQRRQGPDLRQQQRRRRRLRPRPAARDAPDQQDDLDLRRREQGVRAPVPGRRTRARVHAAGHAGRELRAGGAGIPAFFTRTGVGTIVAEGKETREFDGRHKDYVMERGSAPTSRWSRPGRPTSRATSSTARRRATSTRSWRCAAR